MHYTVWGNLRQECGTVVCREHRSRALPADCERAGEIAGEKLDHAELQYLCYSARMKTTLTVSSRGVVTLPAKFREALGISVNDHVIAEATPEGILLRPTVTLPIEMYSAARIKEFDSAEADLAATLERKATTRIVTKAARQSVARKSIRLR